MTYRTAPASAVSAIRETVGAPELQTECTSTSPPTRNHNARCSKWHGASDLRGNVLKTSRLFRNHESPYVLAAYRTAREISLTLAIQ